LARVVDTAGHDPRRVQVMSVGEVSEFGVALLEHIREVEVVSEAGE
jgi:hypothetical protein